MDNWIWAIIIVIVLAVAFFSLKNKKPYIVRTGGNKSFYDKVKDACCGRR